MTASPLAGKRVLIVEDDFIVSQYLRFVLAQAGATPIGPVHGGQEAIDLAGAESLDGALLDFALRDSTTEEVAEFLDIRGVPFVLVSAYPKDTLPRRMRGRPFLSKPVEARALVHLAVREFGQAR